MPDTIKENISLRDIARGLIIYLNLIEQKTPTLKHKYIENKVKNLEKEIDLYKDLKKKFF